MKRKLIIALIAMSILNANLMAQTKPAVMGNANVIKLHKAALGNDIIISKIESSTCKFDLSEDGLIALKKEGVPDPVIKAMMDRADAKKLAPDNGTVTQKGDKTPAPAPSRSAIPEPDIINAVYAYDKTARSLKALEKSSATQKGHKAGPIFGTTTFTCDIQGDKSGTRLTQDQAMAFTVNTGGASPDDFVLYKAEVKKNGRSAITSKITGMGSSKGAQGIVSHTVKLLKPGIYELDLKDKPEKGEYLFITKKLDYTTMANMDVYAFGID